MKNDTPDTSPKETASSREALLMRRILRLRGAIERIGLFHADMNLPKECMEILADDEREHTACNAESLSAANAPHAACDTHCGWTVDELNADGSWTRNACAFIWETNRDAHLQRDELAQRFPEKTLAVTPWPKRSSSRTPSTTNTPAAPSETVQLKQDSCKPAVKHVCPGVESGNCWMEADGYCAVCS